MRLPKIDFRFLFYTPKNIYLKKKKFNAYKVKKKKRTFILLL